MGSGKTAGRVKMWEFTWVFWSHWLESPLTGIWIFWWTVSTRLPCPSPSPGVCSNSNPLSRWCHQIIPPSVSAFSSCPQSLPESGSFPMSQFFASSGQNIGSFSISLTNEYSVWFPLGLTGLISLLFQGTLKNLLQHHISKVPILWCSAFFMVQLSHPYMTTRKTKTLTIWTFIGKVMSLLFNTLFRFVISFLPGSKCLFWDCTQCPQWFLSPIK